MLSELAQMTHVTGVKQTVRALKAGKAVKVFLASDADSRIVGMVESALTDRIAVERTASMKELGRACGVNVDTAAAAVLRS
jgi:large subunit ribosomal protein L7A